MQKHSAAAHLRTKSVRNTFVCKLRDILQTQKNRKKLRKTGNFLSAEVNWIQRNGSARRDIKGSGSHPVKNKQSLPQQPGSGHRTDWESPWNTCVPNTGTFLGPTPYLNCPYVCVSASRTATVLWRYGKYSHSTFFDPSQYLSPRDTFCASSPLFRTECVSGNYLQVNTKAFSNLFGIENKVIQNL